MPGYRRSQLPELVANGRAPTPEDVFKLGDATERTLKKLGITKEWWSSVKLRFGADPDCDCVARKNWLNRVSDWFQGVKSMSLNWCVGMTTVTSRVDNLLKDSITSLLRAGFPEPHLFIDGLNVSETTSFYKSTSHVPKLGHLENWMSAIFTMYLTNPKADRYALFEDDLLACSNLREYLERCPYPENGYWNLLTHDQNLVMTGNHPGWHKSNQRGRGAVGLVFDNKTLRDLLGSPIFIDRAAKGKKCADGLVIDSLKPLGYTEYVHYPSLLQHTGLVSAIGPGHHYGNVRGFKGEDYNPLQILEQAATPSSIPCSGAT